MYSKEGVEQTEHLKKYEAHSSIKSEIPSERDFRYYFNQGIRVCAKRLASRLPSGLHQIYFDTSPDPGNSTAKLAYLGGEEDFPQKVFES